MLSTSLHTNDFENEFRNGLTSCKGLFAIDLSSSSQICGPTLSSSGVVGDVGFYEKAIFDKVATEHQKIYYEGLNVRHPEMARTYYLHVSGALTLWKNQLKNIQEFLSLSRKFFELADRNPLDHDRTDPNDLARRIIIEPEEVSDEYTYFLHLFQLLVDDAEAHIANLYGEDEVQEGFDIDRYRDLDSQELEEQIEWVEAFIDRIRDLQPEAENLLDRCKKDFFALID